MTLYEAGSRRLVTAAARSPVVCFGLTGNAGDTGCSTVDRLVCSTIFPLLDTISSLILFFPSVVASLKQNFRTSSIIFTCKDFFRRNFLSTMKKISRFLLTKVPTSWTCLGTYILRRKYLANFLKPKCIVERTYLH